MLFWNDKIILVRKHFSEPNILQLTVLTCPKGFKKSKKRSEI